MNKINYKESIDLLSPIKELLIINIDENFTTTNKTDFVNVKGEIRISGEVEIENERKSFIHPIDVDISLSKEKLSNDNVNLLIDDFTYNINNNFIDIDLFLKIEGLKEMEESFPSQDDREVVQVSENNIEDENEPEVIDEQLSFSEDVDLTSNESEDFFDRENDQPIPLLSQIFKNRNIKKESVYLIHVVKYETTYQEIASLYNLDENLIKEANIGKKIEKGKLIFIPKK